MKEFEEFMKKGDVKKRSPDLERAKSLVIESEQKRKFLKSAIKNIPPLDMIPNFIVDSCYDMIIELLRAKLFKDGFNSKSHQAEVAYMKKLDFTDGDIIFMDELRYQRNGIKYYGSVLDKEYSRKVLEFADKIYPKLKKVLED